VIPELFAAEFNIELYSKTVFGEIANTKYEGTFKNHGDKLTIPTMPDIPVRKYIKGQKLVYTKNEPGTVVMNIDQGFYWAFPANALDQKQAQFDFVPPWMAHGTKNVQIEIDKEVLAYTYAQAHVSNTGASAGIESGNINLGAATAPLQLTASNAVRVVLDAALVLDEQNADDDGRYMVLPLWATQMIKDSDIKVTSLTGDSTSPIRNGRIGMIDRFKIFGSNNLHTGTDTVKVWDAVFGQMDGLSFAAQLTASERFMDNDDFGEKVRALVAYGRKVVKPALIGHLYLRGAS